MKFGAYLRRARKNKRLSMRQLGEAMGVDPMTVWRWEKERVAPRRKMLPLLANVLGVELRDLFYYYFS